MKLATCNYITAELVFFKDKPPLAFVNLLLDISLGSEFCGWWWEGSGGTFSKCLEIIYGIFVLVGAGGISMTFFIAQGERFIKTRTVE